ncbi:MAG TPA: hypothetical protein VF982_00500, partial [Anaerolineales bacterium]
MAEHQPSTKQGLQAAGLGSVWGMRNELIWRALANRLAILLPVAIILLAFAARLIPGPRTIDDAYITFRYARNILAGNGLVYNPGERVLGTTTPLFAFLLAALGAVSGGTQSPFPILAMLVNALADAITCLL